MAYNDLRDFIKALEKAGEIKKVNAKVDPILEVAEITDRVSKEYGPALMFENVDGSDHNIVINIFGSIKRMCMALEVDDLDALGNRIINLMDKNTPQNFMDKLKSLPMLVELSNILPKTVKKGPCKEVILKGDDVDLFKFPVIKCWPQDAGRFITMPCVFTKDPETGTRNCGMYRMQVYDKNTTGMHWHIHHGGADHFRKAKRMGMEKLEVAVALGCETVDLEVPANSEIVLEGYVLTDELRREGPFGDHTGYYSLADDFPVFHITCITHRKDAIYPTTIVGKPPMEDCYMGVATGRIFLPILKKQVPEIVDMYMPLEGVFHNIMFLSIDKKYPMQAHKIMHYVWGTGQWVIMWTGSVIFAL